MHQDWLRICVYASIAPRLAKKLSHYYIKSVNMDNYNIYPPTSILKFSQISPNMLSFINLVSYLKPSFFTMEKSWSFLARGFFKVNVHDFSLDHSLLNDSDSEMEVVMRDDRGTIIKMYCGMIRNLIMVGNKLWSMVIGLKGDFLKQEYKVELETDNPDRFKKWED